MYQDKVSNVVQHVVEIAVITTSLLIPKNPRHHPISHLRGIFQSRRLPEIIVLSAHHVLHHQMIMNASLI